MTYAIRVHAKLEHDFERIPPSDQDRIMEAIRVLEDDPRPLGSKKLSGIKPNVRNAYRIRIGNYRVGYQVFDRELMVFIVAAAERGDVYQLFKRRLKK